MQIGDLRVDAVHDGWMVLSPEFEYRGAVAAERWDAYRQHLDAGGNVVNEVGGYLVRGVDHRVVLVDCGIGPSPEPPWRGGGLPESLSRLGVARDDVTDVVFTHLHFDHIGWTSRGGVAWFPNARYHAHAADWDFFYSPSYEPVRTERPRDVPYRRLAPVADRFSFWDADCQLLAGIRVRCAPGHTPGSSIVELRSAGEAGLLIGDVAHNPAELLEDDWPGVADHDPPQARATARALAAELVDSGTPFAAAHFAGMRWGRLVNVDGRRRWVEAG
jgi:glyoxylase-like metal-dependent hydrolase (beta-lactamase superfamily II)